MEESGGDGILGIHPRPDLPVGADIILQPAIRIGNRNAELRVDDIDPPRLRIYDSVSGLERLGGNDAAAIQRNCRDERRKTNGTKHATTHCHFPPEKTGATG